MYHKGWSTGLVVSLLLAGCGGGGSDAVTDTPATPAPTPPVVTPPVVVTPAVTVQSGTLKRVLANGVGINLAVTAQASNFTPVGTLYATVGDNGGVFQTPVQVTAGADGRYTFALDTARTLSTGNYKGTATIKLCSDEACTTAQAVASISVPYDLTVLSSDTAWPGDNLTTLAAMTGAGDWSTLQGNSGHTGYVGVEINPNQIGLRWKRGAVNASTSSSPTSGYGALLSPLVTANGLFYASDTTRLTAYKEQDGSSAWTYSFPDTGSTMANPPTVAGGVVYASAIQSDGTYMFAFDASNGNVRFRSRMGSQWDRALPPIVQDSVVYANAGSYGNLYGFSLTGETLFTNSVTQATLWAPAADAKGVYVYTGDALTVYQPKTGEKLATIRDSAYTSYYATINGAPVIGAKGVYAAIYGYGGTNSSGNALTRFDTDKGFADWRIKGNYGVAPAYAAGVLYAPNGNPLRVEARAEADGVLQWSWTPQLSTENGFYGSPLITKNLLFVSTNRATYAIDLVSHKPVWSFPLAGHLSISQNGVLYIQGTDALVAINLK
ncbi:MAG: PQQ-binding-like beta-propeller repeat protein [Duganella sp.]